LSYHSMTSKGENIYLFGGCTLEHGRTNGLWVYNIQQKQWHSIIQPSTVSVSDVDSSPIPIGRGGASIVAASDGLHVLFGYNGITELADHFLVIPPSDPHHHHTSKWHRIIAHGDLPEN